MRKYSAKMDKISMETPKPRLQNPIINDLDNICSFRKNSGANLQEFRKKLRDNMSNKNHSINLKINSH